MINRTNKIYKFLLRYAGIYMIIFLSIAASVIFYVRGLINEPAESVLPSRLLTVELPEKFEYMGEMVDLAWTDNNDNENLIIQSDKKYYDGNGQTEVYFSVTNATDKTQNADIIFWFDGADKELMRVEASRTDRTFKTNGNRTNGTDWTYSGRKDVNGYVDGDYFQDTFAAGETNFYKAVIKYPADQSQTEFFIEAFGESSEPQPGVRNSEKKIIGYGHLDPYLSSGLVGYWSFNGQDMNWANTTAEALDRSGNSNNGNVVNGAKPVSGISGQALDFDGVYGSTGSYLTCGADSSLDITRELTVSAWVYAHTTGTTQGRVAVNRYDYNAAPTPYTGWLFGVVWTGNNFSFSVNDGADGNAAAGISNYFVNELNEWHLITGIYKPSEYVKIYMDGVYQSQDITSVPASIGYTAGFPLRIGVRSDGFQSNWDGLIDEVRVYNRAFSADEIAELYRRDAKKMQVNSPQTNFMADDGLVGYWSFNGQDMNWASTTAEALDRSGNNNNGDIINGAKPVSGISSQAMQFDGVDDYINCGQKSSLDITGSTTLGAWVKIPTNPVYGDLVIISKGVSISGYTLTTRTNNTRLVLFAGGTSVQSNTFTSIADNRWHFVYAVYNKANVNFYLDGTNVGTQALTADSPSTSYNVWIGKYNGSPWPYQFQGQMDEARLYNRALSAEEIGELYRAGAKKMQVNAPQTNLMADDGLVGYWSFNGQDMNWASTTAEALDRSGNGNNCDVGNAKPGSGISGQAMSYDGANDSLNCGSKDNLDFGDVISISYWIKGNSVQNNYSTIMNKNYVGSGGYGWSLQVYQTGPDSYMRIDTSGGTNQSSERITNTFDGTWHHIVWILNNGSRKGYKDGVIAVDNTYIHGDGFNGADANLWMPSNSALSLRSSLDEVRIYHRALSAEEIGELYRAGARRVKY